MIKDDFTLLKMLIVIAVRAVVVEYDLQELHENGEKI